MYPPFDDTLIVDITGTMSEITAMVFSSDNRILYTGHSTGLVQQYHTNNGSSSILLDHGERLIDLYISQDGTKLISV